MVINTVLREVDSLNQRVWHSYVTLDADRLDLGAIDLNKKTSTCKACLSFFKAIFPPGYTYLEVVKFVMEKPDPVTAVLQEQNSI